MRAGLVVGGVFYSALGFSTRAILRARPAVSHTVSRVSGTAMVVIGLLLLVERLAPMVHA